MQKKEIVHVVQQKKKKLDSHTTLPFGAVSILIARRASNRTRPILATYLDIHTWRTDFPAS